MPRVILTITYTIKPEKREEYLSLAREMKEHFSTVRKKNYGIFEGKVKRNQFTEMFIADSMEEFEALDDNMDEKSDALLAKLEEYLDGDGMKYNTIVESL
jgi:L-rhamnose mutarotase